MGAPFSMNSYLGKQILALLREGDDAHAGEEDAIELAMRAVPKNSGHSSWTLVADEAEQLTTFARTDGGAGPLMESSALSAGLKTPMDASLPEPQAAFRSTFGPSDTLARPDVIGPGSGTLVAPATEARQSRTGPSQALAFSGATS